MMNGSVHKNKTKRWYKPSNVANKKEFKVVKLWDGIERDEKWIVTYLNWDVEIVSIPYYNFRERALIRWDKNLSDELRSISYIYDKNIRTIQSINEAKRNEYTIIRKIHVYDDDGNCIGNKEIYTAVKPQGLDHARIELYDIIWRLVSSSPFYNNCWLDRFVWSDLHTSLFLEADDILCSTALTNERRVNKIYYLTHFMKSSTPIVNMFKLDTEYGREIETHREVVPCIGQWTFKDYCRFWIIDETELMALELKEGGYKDGKIAETLWITVRSCKELMANACAKIYHELYFK